MTVRPHTLSLAVLLSFSILLVPLVGPHAFSLLGEHLYRGMTRGDRPLAWLATEIAVTLVMQAVAGAIWYWILKTPRPLRPAVLVVAVPTTFAFAQWCFLVALPTRFLVEHDTASEQRAWSAVCSTPNESLTVVGRRPPVIAPGEVLFVQDSTARLARLTIADPAGTPTCTVSLLALPPPTANDAPLWIGGDDRALLMSIDKRTGAQTWQWIAGRGAAPTPLEEPPGRRPIDGPPLISRNGGAAAWLTPVPDTGQPPTLTIVVRPLVPASAPGVSAKDAVVDLGRLGRASFVLLDLDTAARDVMLAIDERSFASVGFDGAIRWGPLRPEGVEPLSMTFRRLDDGWVAWDGSKDNEAYTVAWALPAGRGRHQIPKGRGVTDVAVQPDGRLIALSVTTSLSIGDVRDAVYVIRTTDGGEVFRRYLPRYARSTVAFPARDLFAYTEWDGARAETIVLRIPPDLLR